MELRVYVLTRPAPCSTRVWSDSSRFVVVLLRDRHGHTHRGPRDLGSVLVRLWHCSSSPSGERVACHRWRDALWTPRHGGCLRRWRLVVDRCRQELHRVEFRCWETGAFGRHRVWLSRGLAGRPVATTMRLLTGQLLSLGYLLLRRSLLRLKGKENVSFKHKI